MPLNETLLIVLPPTEFLPGNIPNKIRFSIPKVVLPASFAPPAILLLHFCDIGINQLLQEDT